MQRFFPVLAVACSLSSSALLPAAVHAQSAEPPAQSAPPATTQGSYPAGQAAPPGPAALAQGLSSAGPVRDSAPVAQQIDDPMLTPVEPAPRVVKDWRTALDSILASSTDYKNAQLQVEIARANSRIALASVLPQLTGTGSLNSHLIKGQGLNFVTQELSATTTIPNPATTYNLGANLRVPLVSARNWYDYATSRMRIGQAESQMDDAERLIIAALAESMVNVVTTERLAEVTRVNLRAALSTLDLSRRRVRLGSGNALDVLRAEQEVAAARAQVIDADEGLRRAREALGQALGSSEPWGLPSSIRLDELRSDARATCKKDQDVASRADIRAGRAAAAIAERNIKSVSYGFLPLVDLNSSLSYSSFRTSVNRKHTTWTIGGTLTWHLYDGGRRYGEQRLNRALAEQSQQQLLQSERTARIEIRQAVRGVNVARQSLAVANRSREIAASNARLSRSKFIGGTGTSFDMVDTERTLRQSSIDVTVKEFELLRAEIIAHLALASCEL